MDRQIPAVALALGVRQDGVRCALGGSCKVRTRVVASLLGKPASEIACRTGEIVAAGVPEAAALDWVLLTAAR